jgi:hypothetical protein
MLFTNPLLQMKKLLILIFSIYATSLYSQSFELAAGANLNRFYQIGEDNPHYTATYETGAGFVVRAAYNFSRATKIPLRLTIAYEQYQGDFRAVNSGLGGGYILDAHIDKSVVTIGFSPLALKLFHNLNISFGADFSILLSEDFSGTGTSWEMDTTTIIKEVYEDDFNASTYFGLNATISYDFHITDDIMIFPQYTFYIGLTKEFDKFPDFTHSMRHFFCIGLKKNIKKKDKHPGN